MSESFRRLKKRFMINAIIVSAVCGVSAGVFAACGALLALKLCGIEINAGYYVLIGAGVAALTGGLLFLIMRPTDKRLAKKLDNKHALNERVQTMVEYRDREGEIIGLQRADADERLSGLPKKNVLLQLAKYVAVPVAAVAMLFTGIFVPLKAEAEDPPLFDLKDMQRTQLTKLIDDVKASDLDDYISDAAVVVLEGLLTALEDVKLESVMAESVVAAVAAIDAVVEEANTFKEIYAELYKQEKVRDIGIAVLKSVSSYSGNKVNTLERVNKLSYDGDEVIASLLKAAIEPVREKLCGKTGEDGTPHEGGLRYDEFKTEAEAFANPIASALEATGYNENDGLYSVLNSFSNTLLTYAEYAADTGFGYSPAAIWNDIDAAAESTVKAGTVALSGQMYRCMMDEFIRTRLAEIFGLSFPKLVFPQLPGSENDPGKEEPPDNSGGAGDNETIYGSDDIIYDYNLGEHVKYGEVFQDYYSKMEERINSGEISGELIKILGEYFKALDIKNKNDEN